MKLHPIAPRENPHSTTARSSPPKRAQTSCLVAMAMAFRFFDVAPPQHGISFLAILHFHLRQADANEAVSRADAIAKPAAFHRTVGNIAERILIVSRSRRIPRSLGTFHQTSIHRQIESVMHLRSFPAGGGLECCERPARQLELTSGTTRSLGTVDKSGRVRSTRELGYTPAPIKARDGKQPAQSFIAGEEGGAGIVANS